MPSTVALSGGLPQSQGEGSPRGGDLRAARWWMLLVSAVSVVALAGCGSSPSTSARKPASGAAPVSIGVGLQGRSGLRASVYAQGPASTSTFALDGQGRLWLAAAGLEGHSHDGVYLVAKAGARAVRVISGLKDPLGMVWDGGELYVASVGRVDRYGAFNGKRFTEHREILDGPVAGAENNLMVLSPDGRLLIGVTATCDHCKPASKYAGAIVSFRPDGSDLRVYAGAIRAPVGLAYLPGTSDLFASMNQRDDLGERTPGDWLSLVREGEQWGFPECYGQGGAPCVGVPQPTAVLDKHAAVGQIAMVRGALGGVAGTSALVSEWASSKVEQVRLTRTGSGYEGTVSTFLTGIHNPLAIVEKGGSLLVGDWTTGKIYWIRSGSA